MLKRQVDVDGVEAMSNNAMHRGVVVRWTKQDPGPKLTRYDVGASEFGYHVIRMSVEEATILAMQLADELLERERRG